MMAVPSCAIQLNNTLKDGSDGELGAYFIQLRKSSQQVWLCASLNSRSAGKEEKPVGSVTCASLEHFHLSVRVGAGSDLKHCEQVTRYENQMKCLLLFFSLGTCVCVSVRVCSHMWSYAGVCLHVLA